MRKGFRLPAVDGPAEGAGVPAERPRVVLSVDGQRDAQSLSVSAEN